MSNTCLAHRVFADNSRPKKRLRQSPPSSPPDFLRCGTLVSSPGCGYKAVAEKLNLTIDTCVSGSSVNSAVRWKLPRPPSPLETANVENTPNSSDSAPAIQPNALQPRLQLKENRCRCQLPPVPPHFCGDTTHLPNITTTPPSSCLPTRSLPLTLINRRSTPISLSEPAAMVRPLMRIPLRLSIETTVPTSKLTHLHVCTTKLPLTPPSPPFRTATCYGKYPDGNSSNTKEFVLCPSPRPTAIAEQAGMASPLLDPRNSHHPTSLPDIVITPPSPLPSQLSGPSKAFASERDATAIINGMTLVSAWPRPGTSLNELIFDHIGQQHLSPRDMRGRMMMPSPLLFKGQRQ